MKLTLKLQTVIFTFLFSFKVNQRDVLYNMYKWQFQCTGSQAGRFPLLPAFMLKVTYVNVRIISCQVLINIYTSILSYLLLWIVWTNTTKDKDKTLVCQKKCQQYWGLQVSNQGRALARIWCGTMCIATRVMTQYTARFLGLCSLRLHSRYVSADVVTFEWMSKLQR